MLKGVKVFTMLQNERSRSPECACIQYRDKCIADKDKEAPERDDRTLKELIDIWYEARGIELADNERTLKNLIRFCDALGNPIAKEVTTRDWHRYKKQKREEGISDKTLNNILGYQCRL